MGAALIWRGFVRSSCCCKAFKAVGWANHGAPILRSDLQGGKTGARNRHRGESHLSTPATPPDKRVRIRRFEGLSYLPVYSLGIPRESK
jgi:hypothetical protein